VRKVRRKENKTKRKRRGKKSRKKKKRREGNERKKGQRGEGRRGPQFTFLVTPLECSVFVQRSMPTDHAETVLKMTALVHATNDY